MKIERNQYTHEQAAKATTPSHKYPQDIARKLNGADFRILEELDFLARCQAKRSPTGARYCTPSEMYLSRKVGLSRENVSRHVNKLMRLGVLSIQHRRPKHGRWSTNLYRIVSWSFWRVGGFVKRLFKRSHHVTTKAHIAIPMRENIASLESMSLKPDLKAILERWRSRAPAS